MTEPNDVSATATPLSLATRPLSDEELHQLVARNFIGVLSTAADDQPYAVPLIFGYDEHAFFSVLAPGRKVRNMEANARVCLTIVETEDAGKRWRSAVATGTASWVHGVMKIGHALNAIRKQYPGIPVRSAPGLSALKGYHVLRLDVEKMTGAETTVEGE